MDQFLSHTTGQAYKVKFLAASKSSNTVHLIMGERCGLQFVGEMSQPLFVRVTSHQFDIAHRMTDVSPVSEHFNSRVHLELYMMVIVTDDHVQL